MGGANPDARLRLVPLISTFVSITKPLLELDQVFDLAKRGEIRLYVRIPPDKVAYVDGSLPIVSHRRSGTYRSDGSWYLSYYWPQSSQIRPELTHVALDPDQAEDLKREGLTSEMVFSSGLQPHPEGALAQAGWLAPCQYGTSLVICPTLPTPTSAVEKRTQRVRRSLLKARPEDILIDERVISLLQDPSSPDDPFCHRERAPLVHALYAAAERFHGALKEKTISFEVVQDYMVDQLTELGKTDALRIAKFINPRHRRNSGVPEQAQKKFDVHVLNSSEFVSRYKREGFVNDALALIFYVTDRWLDARASFKEGARKTPPSRSYIDGEFDRLGFYQKERDALTRLVIARRHASPA